MSFQSLYLEKVDALSLATTHNTEENDKDNIKDVGIKNELNAQTKLESHFAFLAKDVFFANYIDKKTDWENYFLPIFIAATNDSSERSDNNTMEIDNILNQKSNYQ